jgi:hypothetical protein
MRNDKKTIFVYAAAFLLLLTASISAIGVSKITYVTNIDNTFNIQYIDESKIEIVINPDDFDYSIIEKNQQNFAILKLDGEGFTTTIGEACLPAIRRMVEIPQAANPEVVVNSVSWSYTSLEKLDLPNKIIPVQPSIVKMPDASVDFVIDEQYYSSNTFVPKDVVKIVDINEIRSRRFALVEISPILYNPATEELKILSSCEITINLQGSDIQQTYEKINRYTSSSFEELFKTAFVNYGFYEKDILDNPRNQETFLIIVYDSFYSNIQPLADWKGSKGFDVTVTTTSDIPGGPTKENIKAYIVEAYNTWPTPPTYILLVGDTGQVPTWTGTETGTCTDLYYVTIDTGNYFADIIISRFPAATAEQVTTMVDKTIYYESGSFQSYEWLKKAVFMASEDNYQVSEGTHNYVIDTYLLPNGYTCDKLYSHTYSATTAQVSAAINDGRSLAIYSGHGSTTSWADGPPFSQSNVNTLTNNGFYPFVCSHACLTNQFTVSECFGETWLRAQNKGSFAFWGATTNSYWDEDDVLEKSMFKSWWEDNIEDIGGMTNMALFYLYQHYGGGGLTKYYFEEYNVLGDSSVKIWRTNPSDPPEKPSIPAGPNRGVYNKEYSFSSSTTEPDGESIFYLFDWDDGNNSGWLGPYNSGETVNASYAWCNIGDYEIRVVAKDVNGVQSPWSDPLLISIVENNPPNKPTINGSTKAIPFISYDYTISTTDDDGDNVRFYIDWGDGESIWFGPYASGESFSVKHKWMIGSHIIKVKARDSVGDESEWATLEISAPKNNLYTFNIILQRLLQRFPHLLLILKNIIAP